MANAPWMPPSWSYDPAKECMGEPSSVGARKNTPALAAPLKSKPGLEASGPLKPKALLAQYISLGLYFLSDS
ncbi:hypothetical protein ES703_72353 [subsurface metagenome]